VEAKENFEVAKVEEKKIEIETVKPEPIPFQEEVIEEVQVIKKEQEEIIPLKKSIDQETEIKIPIL
jgi:hypothetical protein